MTEQDKQGAEPDLRNAPPAGLTPRQKEIQRRQFASEQQGAEREAFKTWWCASDEYNYAHTGSAASAWEAGRAALRAEQQGQEPEGYFVTTDDGRWIEADKGVNRAHTTPLYTRPAPASQPVGEVAQAGLSDVDKKRIAHNVHVQCSLIPGATFYNAADIAIDAILARSGQPAQEG
ncbi:hypothetical protein CURE108131_22990 [Cupriavidus respiraculi]|uniref:Uncharacterized protein n=1 Tax=Cupriavidus respiraculi TaxID=195930 RepID=A0ABM8WY78_9BURK|nr:hypothetical protein [Cupriavidus respiraculi]CAG9172513.1 hypothetical protein LMG21510_01997 [Cupriavidus respiraculi]